MQTIVPSFPRLLVDRAFKQVSIAQMKLVFFAPSLLTFGYTLGLPQSSANCRCLSTEQCWPQPAEFQQLASQVSQPLLHPVPPQSACYPISNPSGNCSDVTQNLPNGNWGSDQPGLMQNTNWETFTFDNGSISACYLNTSLGAPCQQGSVPVIGVDARSAADVQATVKFVNSHNLRLVVKNTGYVFPPHFF
jgi:hypothetical protein